MIMSRNLISGFKLTESHQLIVCGIAPGGIYAVLIIALVLISRTAKRASAGQIALASFIDIQDTAGLPFLIVVPTIKPSSTAKPPLAKAVDARGGGSVATALPLGDWA